MAVLDPFAFNKIILSDSVNDVYKFFALKCNHPFYEEAVVCICLLIKWLSELLLNRETKVSAICYIFKDQNTSLWLTSHCDNSVESIRYRGQIL